MADIFDEVEQEIIPPVPAVPLVPSKPSFLNRFWKLLGLPERKAREGLGQLADFVPNPEPVGKEGVIAKTARRIFPIATSVVPEGALGDVARGAPKVVAESMAEVAPSFVDRAAITTAGASNAIKAGMPVIKLAGKGLAKIGAVSGVGSKTLEAVAANPNILFAKGIEAANELYKKVPETKGLFDIKSIKNPKHMIETAEKLADKKLLSPDNALEARKALDMFYESKAITPSAYRRTREIFSGVAKKSKKIAKADKARAVASIAERARSPFPLNKDGSVSSLKSTVMSVAGGAALAHPALLPVSALTMSPLVQSFIAAGLGTGARAAANPRAMVASKAVLDHWLKKKENKGK